MASGSLARLRWQHSMTARYLWMVFFCTVCWCLVASCRATTDSSSSLRRWFIHSFRKYRSCSRHLPRHCLLRHLNPVRVSQSTFRSWHSTHSSSVTCISGRTWTAQDGLEKQAKLLVRLLHSVCHPPAALALCRGSRGRSSCRLLVVQPHDCFTWLCGELRWKASQSPCPVHWTAGTACDSSQFASVAHRHDQFTPPIGSNCKAAWQRCGNPCQSNPQLSSELWQHLTLGSSAGDVWMAAWRFWRSLVASEWRTTRNRSHGAYQDSSQCGRVLSGQSHEPRRGHVSTYRDQTVFVATSGHAIRKNSQGVGAAKTVRSARPALGLVQLPTPITAESPEVKTKPDLSSFLTSLLCWPPTLTCLSATAAVAWCGSDISMKLPKSIRDIILQHSYDTIQHQDLLFPESVVMYDYTYDWKKSKERAVCESTLTTDSHTFLIFTAAVWLCKRGLWHLVM